MAKFKAKITVNNRLKGTLGDMDPKTNRIRINVRAHKGDRAELASTIKHELMHVRRPKLTEKQVYKRTAKTRISPAEQSRLIAKLRHKRLNYKIGAVKRKLKINRSDKMEPGSLISRATPLTKRQVALRGLI